MTDQELIRSLTEDFAPRIRELCADDKMDCDNLCAGNILTAKCIVFQAADRLAALQAENEELMALGQEAASDCAKKDKELADLRAENAEKDKEIERMATELKLWREQAKTEHRDKEMYNGMRLKAKAALSRVEAERDAAVADLHSMHTLCMDIGGCCPECGSQIDELLDAACTFCKGPGVSCWKNDLGNGNKCAAFEWRGAQGEG